MDSMNFLLTSKEVAALIRHKVSTLSIWRKKGIGPTFYKFNNRYFYYKSDVEDFIEKNKNEINK